MSFCVKPVCPRMQAMDRESSEINRREPGPVVVARPSVPEILTHDTTLAEVRSRTPARILIGHAGPAYRTATWLELRRDHAAARDAVCAELDLTDDLGRPFVDRMGAIRGEPHWPGPRKNSCCGPTWAAR